MDVRERFASEVAPWLASEAAGAEVTPWDPRSARIKVSRRVVLFEGDDQLIAVTGAHEPPRKSDLALAYGLAVLGERDLLVVLPACREGATLRRAAFLDVPVRVFAADRAVVTEVPVPARERILAGFDDDLVGDGEGGLTAAELEWVADLSTWAADQGLSPAHRSSYLAWHRGGRLVLRVVRTGGGLRVTGGVHTVTQGKYVPLVEHTLVGVPASGVLAEVQRAAAAAAKARDAGDDRSDPESALQECLAAATDQLQLEPGTVRREVPCVRADGSRGYIDLVGVGKDGHLHLVETKIGPDPMLVLQGLDYYVWAAAHRADLVAKFGAPAGALAVDFVVAPRGPSTLGPYASGQLQALRHDIRWRTGTVEPGWEAGTPKVHFERWRTPPAAPAPRWPALMQQVVTTALSVPASTTAVEVDRLVVPEARWAFDDIAARNLLHAYAQHPRSSQTFAVNLFGPLAPEGIAHLLAECLGGEVSTADPPSFEWEDADDRLGESQSKRPHRTQVDVVLRGRRPDGRAVVLLVEVKLSEHDFGWCSAFASPKNDAIQVCGQSGPFGDDPAACFQLRNHGGPHRRRYDQVLAPPTSADGPVPVGCWYRTSASQPMRNAALARLFEADGAEVAFALCAPSGHREIWRRWADAKRVLPPFLRDLPAEHVVAALPDGPRTVVAERYGLEPIA